MKFRFLRPSILLALALGLSACGGDDPTHDINIEVNGLNYDGLVVTDKISGIKHAVSKPATAGQAVKFVFPRKLSYGDEFHILADTQPEHQNCAGEVHDSAGRVSSINVVLTCKNLTPNLKGTIYMNVPGAEATGLTLTNGSLPAFVAVSGSAAYAFNAIPYDTTYGLVITKQPTDGKSKCKLVLISNIDPPRAVSADGLSFSGRMGDTDVFVDVVCNAP